MYSFKVRIIFNIKGAESLARNMRKALQEEFMDKSLTDRTNKNAADQSGDDIKNAFYVNTINCIGYKEHGKDSWIP